MIDAYLQQAQRAFEPSGTPLSEENPALWDRLQQARSKMGASRPNQHPE
jgi:hypothetical protein